MRDMNLLEGLMERLSLLFTVTTLLSTKASIVLHQLCCGCDGCSEHPLRNIRRMRRVTCAFRDDLQHMQPLSEKAKGKQRAEPIPEDVLNNGGPIPPRQLMVRFTEGVEDLVLQVADDDSVRDVKAKVCSYLSLLSAPCPLPHCLLHAFHSPHIHRQIRESRPKLQRRRLRLIHAGRLLTDRTQISSWLGTLEERQQRAATKVKDETDPSTLPTALPTGSSSASAVPWLHCSVGAQLIGGEEEGETQPQVRPITLYFCQDICSHRLTICR